MSPSSGFLRRCSRTERPLPPGIIAPRIDVSETDDEVVARIEDHIRTDHPELVETLSRDEIAGWVEVVG